VNKLPAFHYGQHVNSVVASKMHEASMLFSSSTVDVPYKKAASVVQLFTRSALQNIGFDALYKISKRKS
jgi:hypothetical protein